MDKKIQKIKTLFARYRKNGYLLDFLVKGLGVEQKQVEVQKRYQRFVKEENISNQEYHDTMNTMVYDILHSFFKDNDNKAFIFVERFIKEYFFYMNIFKTTNETLRCSQKQLDFITITADFIPMLSILTVEFDQKNIIRDILPTEHFTSIQKLFIRIEQSFRIKNQKLDKLLFEILNQDSVKDTGYDTILKDINNWLSGEHVPDNRHILMIVSELALHSKEFDENELLIYFKLSKVIQNTYNRAVHYFGKELTQLLIEHFVFLIELLPYHNICPTVGEFERRVNNKYPHAGKDFISRYSNMYLYVTFDLYTIITESIRKKEDYYDSTQKQRYLKLIKENYKYLEILYKIEQEVFFQEIHTILPIRLFMKQMSVDALNDIHELPNVRSEKLASMYILTLLGAEKTAEQETSFLKEINQFIKLYDIDEDPYIAFIQARYYAQKRNYKKATEHYLIALKYGKNCMGVHLKSIINEGLIVSAQDTRKKQIDLINAKSPFTKFYKEAYLYKLIDYLPDELNLHFLNDMKKKFDFKYKNLFPNTKKADPNKMVRNLGIVDTKKIQRIKPDLERPNKLIRKLYTNDLPQLMHFVGKLDYDNVIKLISKGADVNYVRANDNHTVLIALVEGTVIGALPKERSTEENRYKIAELLIPAMEIEILNKKLVKKQETALSYAIVNGYTEIVKLLIDYGIDLEQKATCDEMSALYLCIHCIGFSNKDKIFDYENPDFHVVNPLESRKEMKKIIKANVSPVTTFDEDVKKMLDMQESPAFQAIQDEILKNELEKYKNNQEAYYQIFDLVLQAVKKIDIPHRFNITPLIFATELNEVEIVRKLLDKGANPNWNTDDYYTALDYAERNKNKKLVELLE